MFVLLLGLGATLVARNVIACHLLNYYLQKKFHGAAKVEKVKIGLGKISDLGRLGFFRIAIEGGFIRIKDLDIGYSIVPDKEGTYNLLVHRFKFKDKVVENISLPFVPKKNRILLVKAVNPILGTQAAWSGEIDFKGSNVVKIDLTFENVSLGQALSFVCKEEDVTAAGNFTGGLKAALVQNALCRLSVDLHNGGHGFIDIKKETNLEILRRYLDADSYKTLIEGFKNYQYNEGVITAVDQGRDIVVDFDFVSARNGKRHLSIVLHNAGGKP